MAPITIPTTTLATSSQLDTPVIIIICVFAYLAFFIVAVFVRQCIVPLDRVCCQCKSSSKKSRGFCAECNICGKADDTNNCCDCCLSLAQICNCTVPGATTCCDSICGPRSRCDPGDCLACGPCCKPDDTSQVCSCIECACACQSPDCDRVNCLCFEVQLR